VGTGTGNWGFANIELGTSEGLRGEIKRFWWGVSVELGNGVELNASAPIIERRIQCPSSPGD
jgi:hypothetical protein